MKREARELRYAREMLALAECQANCWLAGAAHWSAEIKRLEGAKQLTLDMSSVVDQ